MPYRHDPHDFRFDAIEEPIWRNDQFAIWKIREFGDETTRLGKLLKSPQERFGFLPKTYCSRGIVLLNVSDRGQELQPCGRRKLHFHRLASGEERIRLGKNGGEVVPFPGSNFLFPLRQTTQKLTVVFGSCISLGAHHDCRCTPALRDDDRLFRIPNPAEHRRGVLPQIRDWNDTRNLTHYGTS